MSYFIFSAQALPPTPAPRPSTFLKSHSTQQAGVLRGLQRGVITRASVEEAVQGGVPRILAQLRLAPERREGAFYGFKLVQLTSQSLASRAGFQEGDIILTVNDEPIGRPDQMMHALSLLPFAEQLVIQFERSGRVQHWAWGIQ